MHDPEFCRQGPYVSSEVIEAGYRTVIGIDGQVLVPGTNAMLALRLQSPRVCLEDNREWQRTRSPLWSNAYNAHPALKKPLRR